MAVILAAKRDELAPLQLIEIAFSALPATALRLHCTSKVSFGSFSSDQPAPDALGMSAALRIATVDLNIGPIAGSALFAKVVIPASQVSAWHRNSDRLTGP